MPGLAEAPSQWTGETAFWLAGREIVHLHGDDIEIRLTRRVIGDLDDARVWRRTRTSDWVGTHVGNTALALELVRRAIAANRR